METISAPRGEETPCLETRRLILRPWREEDAPDLYEWARDPRVGPAAGWPAHRSLEESVEILRTVLSAPLTWALVDRETGRAVGSIGLKGPAQASSALTLDPKERELGYWLCVPLWGRGLMQEAVGEVLRFAFRERGLSAVWAGYYEGNHRSRRTQEAWGFRPMDEGVERVLGEERVVVLNRLTREEWTAARSRCVP